MSAEMDRMTELYEYAEGLIARLQMQQSLFFEVVERTQNFREGFYSMRKIQEAVEEVTPIMSTAKRAATLPEIEVLMAELVAAIIRVEKTIEAEIKRIDS